MGTASRVRIEMILRTMCIVEWYDGPTLAIVETEGGPGLVRLRVADSQYRHRLFEVRLMDEAVALEACRRLSEKAIPLDDREWRVLMVALRRATKGLSALVVSNGVFEGVSAVEVSPAEGPLLSEFARAGTREREEMDEFLRNLTSRPT